MEKAELLLTIIVVVNAVTFLVRHVEEHIAVIWGIIGAIHAIMVLVIMEEDVLHATEQG